MESCTGQWLPGFPHVESVHSSLRWMQNIFSGFFCPGHHSRKSCCVVGFELNQDVVFLKICPFLRSSEIGAVGGDASVIVDVPVFILEQFD